MTPLLWVLAALALVVVLVLLDLRFLPFASTYRIRGRTVRVRRRSWLVALLSIGKPKRPRGLVLFGHMHLLGDASAYLWAHEFSHVVDGYSLFRYLTDPEYRLAIENAAHAAGLDGENDPEFLALAGVKA